MPLHQETYDIFHEYFPSQALPDVPQSLPSQHTVAQDLYAQQPAFVHPSSAVQTNFPTIYMPLTNKNGGGFASDDDLQTLAAQISSNVYQQNAQSSHQYGNYEAYSRSKNSQYHGR